MYIQIKHKIPGRRVLAGIAVAVTLSVFCSSVSLADDLSSLQNKYDTLGQEQKSLQQQIDGQSAKVKSQKQKVDALNASAKITVQQISLLNEQITTLDAQLTAKANDIAATKKRISDNMALYKQRLRANYEAGDVSFVNVLLSCNNINDFLMRVQILRTISDYDTKLLNSLKQDEQRLESDQAELQSSEASLQSKKSDLTVQQVNLNKQLTQQGQILAQLTSAQNATKQQSQDIKKQQAEIDAEINAIIEQEAEAKRRQMQQSGGGSSGATGPVSASASDIIAYGETLIGKPYRLNTAGPSTYDCSGFTQQVFAHAAGIFLPRTAAEQGNVGTPVSQNNLAPGDLVFFNTEGYVSHVGIYIGGNQFIAANTSTGVAITQLFGSSYWGPRYLFARRVL